MFLLCKPTTTKPDGMTIFHTPFVIGYAGTNVYAAFTTTETARYFIRAVGLETDYQAVPLASADLADLQECDHALVLRYMTEVDRLLTGFVTPSDFANGLVAIR